MATLPDKSSPLLSRYFSQTMTLMGEVHGLDTSDPNHPWFNLRVRVGDYGATDDVPIVVAGTAYYQPLTNLDGVNRDRYPKPEELDKKPPAERAKVYLVDGVMVAVEGIHQRHDGTERFEARVVHLLQQAPVPRGTQVEMDKERQVEVDERRFYFEYTYWWLNQIQRLADKWLDDLFGERRDYQLADFAALYRTNLNILGLPTDDNVQEMATLSRLIYGLSSAYLLNGIDRYLHAAQAGVAYQREAFRGTSADGRFIFWSSAKRRQKYGSQYVMTSQNTEDRNTIPLYEQIYALAGLCQYYRITNDHEVLEDIRRTVRMFQAFFRDKSGKGYYSHLDYVTFSPRDGSLGINAARKNWNSIGDHIPAYLVNLILALDPVPAGRDDLASFLDECKALLAETSDLICEHFPRQDSAYVQERFQESWDPDVTHGWQQDRGIVGHNLKIAWNLTRAANYFYFIGDEARARRCMEVADRLGKDMATGGLDPMRGGCFDAVQRHPQNGMPVEFAWGNSKDFWQQEQGILAYLILHGNSPRPADERAGYQRYAREMMAFWNLFFLDRENQGVYFRTTENGMPVVTGGYGAKAGHSVAGYHSFELNYLAHIYLRAFFARPKTEHQRFTLYFRPDSASQLKSINVLPDFFRPGTMTLSALTINGRRVECAGRTDFQVILPSGEYSGTVIVEFQPIVSAMES